MNSDFRIPDRLDLERILFVGRTLSEYVKFFDLDLSSLKGWTILDCPSGPSSFVAEANSMGIHAVACDPLFSAPIEELVNRAESDIEYVMARLSKVTHLYEWEHYTSVEAVRENRTRGLLGFEKDYTSGIAQKRYIKAALPHLPFINRSYDLVLSAHFLFIYSDKFDYKFHLESTLELCRVSSREVRIYPLQGLDAKPYEYIDRLFSDLGEREIVAEAVKVPFEFLKGSNQMLRLLIS
jgi:hypothetical protein